MCKVSGEETPTALQEEEIAEILGYVLLYHQHYHQKQQDRSSIEKIVYNGQFREKIRTIQQY